MDILKLYLKDERNLDLKNARGKSILGGKIFRTEPRFSRNKSLVRA